MSRFTNLFLSLALVSAVTYPGAALAMDATAPEQAPRFFFEAMYSMDYVQAWSLLTPKSQSELIALIQKTESNPELTTEVLKRMFSQGERPLTRGFWTQMRQSMGIQIWHEQNFQVFEQDEKLGTAFVRAMPTDLLVFVQSDNKRWKFGYVESFVELRKPEQKDPKSPEGGKKK